MLGTDAGKLSVGGSICCCNSIPRAFQLIKAVARHLRVAPEVVVQKAEVAASTSVRSGRYEAGEAHVRFQGCVS